MYNFLNEIDLNVISQCTYCNVVFDRNNRCKWNNYNIIKHVTACKNGKLKFKETNNRSILTNEMFTV